jgi:N-ethylmaleimide reductase
MDTIFEPIKMSNSTLKNRVVMAPLTRSRADNSGNPTDMMTEYYAQRSGAGLIISEATNISKEAYGYELTPGIFSNDQIAGWKKITQAVHKKDGKIFCQLWHCGRISHEDLQPDGQKPVAPSAINPDAEAFVNGEKKKTPTPRALETQEISRIISEYVVAAKNAIEAGFDGVEVHSANGYLLHQFISDSSNKRDDQYGGSIENRCRFTLDTISAVVSAIGADKVGIRLAPVSDFNNVSTENPQKTYEYIVEQLNEFNINYIHVIEGKTQGDRDYLNFDYKSLKEKFNGLYIGNNNYDLELAKKRTEDNSVDMVCFGRPFIANPDLVTRFKENASLNELDEDTMYSGGEHGYTDYPKLNEEK